MLFEDYSDAAFYQLMWFMVLTSFLFFSFCCSSLQTVRYSSYPSISSFPLQALILLNIERLLAPEYLPWIKEGENIYIPT